VAVLVVVAVVVLAARLISGAVSLFGSDGDRTPLTQGTGSPSPSGAPTVIPPPACSLGNRFARFRDLDEWQLTLLDTTYRLPRAYVPPRLQPISKAGFKSPLLVRSEVIDDLAALRGAAVAAALPIGVVAAYRSYDQQARLFERRQEQLGNSEALAKTARPGHSEHQLGTAVDFKSAGERDVNQNWDRTPTGKWVNANAWRFGFVQSYPRGLQSVTCYGNEPWHFRYFGRTLSAEIHRSRLTVREFLWSEQKRGGAPIP
jgi:D-alanyl-D-alanine carboxypeptidase